jgi:hypothetical protein
MPRKENRDKNELEERSVVVALVEVRVRSFEACPHPLLLHEDGNWILAAQDKFSSADPSIALLQLRGRVDKHRL